MQSTTLLLAFALTSVPAVAIAAQGGESPCPPQPAPAGPSDQPEGEARSDADAVSAAIRKFAWYYGCLGGAVLLLFLVGVYAALTEADIPVAVVVLVPIVAFMIGHVLAVWHMTEMVDEARKAMGMRGIGGLGCALQVISFFVLAWPLHILGIVHVYKLVKCRRSL